MSLWINWFFCVKELRGACSRQRTFIWMTIVLASMSIRSELLGVTSFIRSAFIHESCYRLLLHHFHSNALNIEKLCSIWIRLALRIFKPVIAQGLLQYLAVCHRKTVWASFGSWLRTMKTDMVPSEMVVAQALRSSLPDFLLSNSNDSDLKKFIIDHAEYDRLPGFKMAA